MEPCIEPLPPNDIIGFMRKGRVDDAATEYARYVLDVRDAFQLCNGRLALLREWWKGELDAHEP